LGLQDEQYFENVYNDAGHTNSLRIAHHPAETRSSTQAEATAADTAVLEVSGTDRPRPRLRYGAHIDYQDLSILKPVYSDWSVLETSPFSASAAPAAPDLVPSCGGLQILPRQYTTAATSTTTSSISEDAWLPVIIDHSPHDPVLEVPLIGNIGDFWTIWTADRWRSPVYRHSGALLLNSIAKAQGSQQRQHQHASAGIYSFTAASLPVAPPAARQALVYVTLPLETAEIKPLDGARIIVTAFREEEHAITAGQHLQNKIRRSNI